MDPTHTGFLLTCIVNRAGPPRVAQAGAKSTPGGRLAPKASDEDNRTDGQNWSANTSTHTYSPISNMYLVTAVQPFYSMTTKGIFSFYPAI